MKSDPDGGGCGNCGPAGRPVPGRGLSAYEVVTAEQVARRVERFWDEWL